jgi:SOS-response transcriptional repressor LexA
VPKAWQHDEAVDAVREWLEEHGRPPTWSEWAKAAEGRPTSKTVQRRWGWHQLLAEATGVSPEQVRELMEWRVGRQGAHRTQQRMLEMLKAAGAELGRSPAWAEWEQAGGQTRPPAKTVARRLGSWTRALEEAGLDFAARRRSEAWQLKRREREAARTRDSPADPARPARRGRA